MMMMMMMMTARYLQAATIWKIPWRS